MEKILVLQYALSLAGLAAVLLGLAALKRYLLQLSQQLSQKA